MLLIDSFRLYHLVFPVCDRFHSSSAGGEVASDGCRPSAEVVSYRG